MQELGKPHAFSVDLHLDAVEQMIECDEVEIAFRMLSQMPAWYRDHIPERAIEIRESLNRQLFTPVQYTGLYNGAPLTEESLEGSWLLRYHLVEQEVKRMNTRVHIAELAPGAHVLSGGLKLKNYDFTYECLGLDGHMGDRHIDKSVPSIFCAFELLEHCHDRWEIYRNYAKLQRDFDVVMLSTPFYNFTGDFGPWRERALGHMFALTPKEFHELASSQFTGRTWQIFNDYTMVLIGRR